MPRSDMREAKPGGVPNPGVSHFFLGKVQIVSRTLSGLFLVGALIGRERGKGQIGQIPGPFPSKSGKSQSKSGKSQKGPKDKKGRTSPDRETPPFSGLE